MFLEIQNDRRKVHKYTEHTHKMRIGSFKNKQEKKYENLIWNKNKYVSIFPILYLIKLLKQQQKNK